MKITKILILLIVIGFASCEVDYYDDPNEPEKANPNTVFNHAVKETMDDLNALFFGGGRFSQTTMQYWHQAEYGDEDRYAYRESMREFFEQFYYNLKNFRKVIELNEDPEIKEVAATFGDHDAQIACTRIMMAYLFNEMTNVWGPLPYWSYGGQDNEDFEALNLDTEDEIIYPKYVSEEVIHEDMLNELDEAYEQLEGTEGFTSGDNIYNGDTDKWQKFANSLRLRIALKIKDIDPGLAKTHIDDVIDEDEDYIESNEDNAVFEYGTSDKNSAPYYYGVHVGNRRDFAVGNSFVTLLQGNNIVDLEGNSLTDNPFDGIEDPRLPIFAKPNDDGNYVGMPIAEDSDIAGEIEWKSYPGRVIDDKPDFPEVLMEYAEVEFILSELNDWDNEHYENAISASIERWNMIDEEVEILPEEIDDFVDNISIDGLPEEERKEHVLTQKYIALYMQANTAFTEYRRTGYPKTFVRPDDEYGVYDPAKDTIYGDASGDEVKPFVFDPIPDAITDDLPSRMRYPSYESTLNEENYSEAASWLENDDALTSKLWWDVD